MRQTLRVAFALLVLVTFGQPAISQFGNLMDRAKRKAENKVNQKIDQKMDQTIDRALDPNAPPSNPKGKSGSANPSSGDHLPNVNEKITQAASSTLQAYSKFDFVAGKTILAFEDFSADAVGDFPARWNTNSTGEIVTVEGKPGKWLSLSKEGVLLPEFVSQLPENFTLEYDVITSDNLSYYTTGLGMGIARLKNPDKEFTQWSRYGPGKSGVMVWIHPCDAGGSSGHTGFELFESGAGTQKNESATAQFFHKGAARSVHVSVWRQKTRLRVYLNEEKVWDLPRVVPKDLLPNRIVFQLGGFHDTKDRYLISNVRLAAGEPDTRNQLLQKGRWETQGITFAVNSSTIRPESYGTLKEIAQVLLENPTLNVMIEGHTDGDGNAQANLELSKRRAEAVAAALQSQFSVDIGKLKTVGKGASEPAASNTSPEGKATNRRVVFIKL